MLIEFSLVPRIGNRTIPICQKGKVGSGTACLLPTAPIILDGVITNLPGFGFRGNLHGEDTVRDFGFRAALRFIDRVDDAVKIGGS